MNELDICFSFTALLQNGQTLDELLNETQNVTAFCNSNFTFINLIREKINQHEKKNKMETDKIVKES